jgi:hypothetical protein
VSARYAEAIALVMARLSKCRFVMEEDHLEGRD